jgi:hypothetical protein
MVTMDTPIDALLLWAANALRCSARILYSDNRPEWSDAGLPPTRLTREIDAAQMLLALRNTLRAAEWLTKNRQHLVGDETALIANFKGMIPNVVSARDALEHFDAYAEGRGYQQWSWSGRYRFELSGEGAEAAVTVGPHSINVQRAREACHKLVAKLMAVTVFEGDMYTLRRHFLKTSKKMVSTLVCWLLRTQASPR